jgi:chromosome segregation ATPase
MSGEDKTTKFTNADGSPSGDDLLRAMCLDMNSLFELVRSLDAKIDARLHDTRPMWETAIARLDGIEEQLKSQGAELTSQGTELTSQGAELKSQGVELKSHGTRLDAIEKRLERFDVIEAELRRLRRKIERMVGELSHNVIEMRVDQQDLEDRIEKLEETPA